MRRMRAVSTIWEVKVLKNEGWQIRFMQLKCTNKGAGNYRTEDIRDKCDYIIKIKKRLSFELKDGFAIDIKRFISWVDKIRYHIESQ